MLIELLNQSDGDKVACMSGVVEKKIGALPRKAKNCWYEQNLDHVHVVVVNLNSIKKPTKLFRKKQRGQRGSRGESSGEGQRKSAGRS